MSLKKTTRQLIKNFRSRATKVGPARKYAGGAGVVRKGIANDLKTWRKVHGRQAVRNVNLAARNISTKGPKHY
jgi:hypothetical protein